MYDPQTVQIIAVLASVAFFAAFILGLFYGLYLLAKIRRQAIGINKRLDELLARTPPGRGSAGETGMSL